MDSKAWNKLITAQCKEAGTYKPEIDPVIETLASILEKRDAAEKQYKDEGSQAIVEKISDRKSVNRVKNPLLQIIMDLNTQALAFWKSLGLTPDGLKKLNGDALTAKATTAGFEQLLAKIAN